MAKGLIYLVGLEQRAARMEALVISDKPLLQEEKKNKLWNKAEKQGLHLSGRARAVGSWK